MITPAAGVRIWLAAGLTDMRRGFDGLAALVQQHLGQDPFSGHLFVFRGKRGHLLKRQRSAAVHPSSAYASGLSRLRR